MHTAQGPQWLSWVIPLVIAGVILTFRMRRMSRSQPLKLERLWVVPAIYVAFAAVVMWSQPPSPWDLPWLGLSFAIGAAIGWWRGAMMRITVDPETHALNQQASPAAMGFLLALVLIRMAMRTTLAGEAETLHISAAFVTDVFIVFALGLFGATRLEMFLRARRLLTAARANG